MKTIRATDEQQMETEDSASSSTVHKVERYTILEDSHMRPSNPGFRGVWHEILFMFIVASAQLITQANLGNTIMPVKAISEALGVAEVIANEGWFVASYSCTVGAFVLITGRLGDLYGRKNLFILGWLWLGIFNIGIGFTKDHIIYDVLRALSGIGPAILMPNAAALLGGAWPDTKSKHDKKRKTIGFCIFGAVAPGGYILGAAWGAAVIHTGLKWGWIYWSMAIVSFGLAAASWLVIPNINGLNNRNPGTVDYLGSIVGVSGLVSVFVATNGGPTWGWKSPISPILLVIGLLLLALFCYIELHVPHPILLMSIFSSHTFVSIAISLCFGWMSFGVFQFYAAQFLLEYRHLTPLGATLQLFPCAPAGVVAAVIAVYLLPRIPTAAIFLAAMVCFLVGQVLMAFQPIEQTYWAMMFPACVIVCFGPDLSFACASLIASDGLRPEEQGVAGSFINTVVNYSVGLGLALAGNVEVRVNEEGMDRLKGFRGAHYLAIGLAGVAVVCSGVLWREYGR